MELVSGGRSRGQDLDLSRLWAVPDKAGFLAWLKERQASVDPLFYAFVPHATGEASGMASFMRMVPEHGVIEIGHIWLSPGLKQTREATEGLYLMMRHALGRWGAAGSNGSAMP